MALLAGPSPTSLMRRRLPTPLFPTEAAAKSIESGSSGGFEYVNPTPSPETPGTPSESSGSQSSISSAAWDQDAAKKSSEYGYANGSGSSLEIATTSNSSLAYL